MTAEEWQQLCDAFGVMFQISIKYGLDVSCLKEEAVYLLLNHPEVML